MKPGEASCGIPSDISETVVGNLKKNPKGKVEEFLEESLQNY